MGPGERLDFRSWHGRHVPATETNVRRLGCVTKTRKRDTAQRGTIEARSRNKQSAQTRQFVSELCAPFIQQWRAEPSPRAGAV